MKTILIVDDKRENNYLLEKLLQGNGFETIAAANGVEALALARKNPPHLIISDVLMPQMDGFTLCREWRKDPQLRGIPFVFYTATYTDPRDEELALSLGANRYIIKPLEPVQFLAEIKKILQAFTAGELISPAAVVSDDRVLLQHYNEALIRKLEQKMIQAEHAEQQLRHYSAELEKRIDELQHASEKIAEQARLLDIAHDAILVRDMNDKLLYFNKAAERLYGWTFEEMQTLDAKMYIYEKDFKILEEGKRRSIETGEWEGEIHQIARDGRQLSILTRWSLVRDAAGNPTARLIINRNVTEQRILEAQLRRTQRLESLGTLASGIAHDLNNVLAPILMATDIMENQIAEPQMKKMIRSLRSSAMRGSDIVKQVLAFARGSEKEFSPQQLRYVVSEIETMIKETFPKNITLKVSLAKEIHPVLGDATQLSQILMNLCVNARDAMPNGGQLTISCSNIAIDTTYARMRAGARPGDYIVLGVTDTGSGIPKEIQEKVFEPFFTTKETGKGTGLGLSTVFTIVKDHKGFIDLYSEVGKGSTFKVYLPAIKYEEPAAVMKRKIVLPSGNGEVILIVDDELTVLQITKETLESYGYKALIAADGAEALSAFSGAGNGAITLLLIDVNMPVMDGPTCIAAVRKIDPSIRVILSSGVPGEIDSVKVSNLHIDGYITKPYTAEKMLTTIQQVLRQDAGT